MGKGRWVKKGRNGSVRKWFRVAMRGRCRYRLDPSKQGFKTACWIFPLFIKEYWYDGFRLANGEKF